MSELSTEIFGTNSAKNENSKRFIGAPIRVKVTMKSIFIIIITVGIFIRKDMVINFIPINHHSTKISAWI